jgi:hypothetical protein
VIGRVDYVASARFIRVDSPMAGDWPRPVSAGAVLVVRDVRPRVGQVLQEVVEQHRIEMRPPSFAECWTNWLPES